MLIQKMVIRHLSMLQDELPCICFGVIVKVIRFVESPATSPSRPLTSKKEECSLPLLRFVHIDERARSTSVDLGYKRGSWEFGASSKKFRFLKSLVNRALCTYHGRNLCAHYGKRNLADWTGTLFDL